jgi:hypothetical protein
MQKNISPSTHLLQVQLNRASYSAAAVNSLNAVNCLMHLPTYLSQVQLNKDLPLYCASNQQELHTKYPPIAGASEQELALQQLPSTVQMPSTFSMQPNTHLSQVHLNRNLLCSSCCLAAVLISRLCPKPR